MYEALIFVAIYLGIGFTLAKCLCNEKDEPATYGVLTLFWLVFLFWQAIILVGKCVKTSKY